MSRKGKSPILLEKGVEIKVNGKQVQVKGPKGSLSLELKEDIEVKVEGSHIVVSAAEKEGISKFHGLYRTLIQNMVTGTSKGFEKILELVGVGYRAAVKGKALDLQLGYSHPTLINIPEGIEVKVDKNTTIVVSGIDKQKVGSFAAEVRSLRPPEPYQGKGVKYKDEYIRRKAGKAAAAK